MKLKHYTFETKEVCYGIDTFRSKLEMDVYLLFLNQIGASFNPDVSLFNDDIVVHLNTSYLGRFNYSRLKKATSDMMKRIIEVESADGKSYVQIAPFEKIYYSNGLISITLRQKYVPLFLTLNEKFFAKYVFTDALQLDSVGAKSLYRILATYHGRRDNTWAPTFDGLKKKLHIQGYINRPSQFATQKIEPMVKNINETTELDVKFWYEKIRTIWIFYFQTTLKGSTSRWEVEVPVELSDEQERAMEKMIKWGIYSSKARYIAENHCKEFWNWQYLKQDQIGNKIKNIGALCLTHFGLTNKSKKV